MRPRSIFGSSMREQLCSVVTISAFALSAGIGRANPETICRPQLELHPFRLVSGVFFQDQTWKADMVGDASHCKEEAGLFELQITRWKENAPDLDFLVTKRWRGGRFEVVLTLAPDEAIGLAQIMWISRCSCTPGVVASGK
jgi:hypothetical protein